MEKMIMGIEKLVYFLCTYDNSRNVTPLGTCFLTNQRGVFATSAHAVSDKTNIAVGIIDVNENPNNNLHSYQDTSINNFKFLPVEVYRIDPLNDVCLLKSESTEKSNLEVSNTDGVSVGERVDVFGYPHSDTGRLVLTQHSPEVGAKILLGNSGGKTKSLVLNMQSRPGQSGSPILVASPNGGPSKLIGMITGAYVPANTAGSISLGGIDPQTLHQTTHAVSAEYLRSLLYDE